jgi:50S ribosomal protein L16 3-hydroxylase
VAVLQNWLGTMQLEQFCARHLGRVPLARPNAARATIAACDWDVFGRLLASRPDDALVVARGRLLDAPLPRSLSELRALFSLGAGVALRKPERDCPEVAAVAAAFARDLPGEQRVIVFATAKDTHGFGWHYDAEDVFIVQTAGDKTYYFRQNSVDPEPVRGAQPDFRTFAQEKTPIMECRLLAGDWLYLPRGYWHVARAHADSLSISIGVFPETTPLANAGQR